MTPTTTTAMEATTAMPVHTPNNRLMSRTVYTAHRRFVGMHHWLAARWLFNIKPFTNSLWHTLSCLPLTFNEKNHQAAYIGCCCCCFGCYVLRAKLTTKYTILYVFFSFWLDSVEFYQLAWTVANINNTLHSVRYTYHFSVNFISVFTSSVGLFH